MSALLLSPMPRQRGKGHRAREGGRVSCLPGACLPPSRRSQPSSKEPPPYLRGKDGRDGPRLLRQVCLLPPCISLLLPVPPVCVQGVSCPAPWQPQHRPPGSAEGQAAASCDEARGQLLPAAGAQRQGAEPVLRGVQ